MNLPRLGMPDSHSDLLGIYNVDELPELLAELGLGLFFNPVEVLSGSTVTAALGDLIIFNSSSGLPKTITAPASTGSLSIIAALDWFGDASDTIPITFVPASGSVNGGLNQLYTHYGFTRWLDTPLGWAQIT